MNTALPASAIEEVITYMTVPQADLSEYHGAMPMTPAFAGFGGDDAPIFPGAPADICPKVDVRLLVDCPHGGAAHPVTGKVDDSRYQLIRVWSAGKVAAKSMGLRPGQHVFHVRKTSISPSGRACDLPRSTWVWAKRSGWTLHRSQGRGFTNDMFLGSVDGHGCMDIMRDERGVVALAPGIQLALRYEWTTRFWFDGCASVRLPTDPEGVCGLFKLRDVPAGKARRDAIIHWVAAHARRKRKDPEATSEVRRHLRGQTDFTWGGFNVRVRPPQFDLEQQAAVGGTKAKQILQPA